MKVIDRLIKKITSWLLPYHCLLCGDEASEQQQDLCGACFHELPILSQACVRCAAPLFFSKNDGICGDCLKDPPHFEVVHTLFFYQAPMTNLILQLKFNHALTHARLFGEWLTKKIQHTWYLDQPLPDCIIPVPLHPKRLRERGFNQALEIARPIAKTLQLPLFSDTCQRIKYTEAQATLLSKRRKKNVRGAFHSETDFTGQHIALVDDVMTTGYTIRELSRVLKKQGARRIDVWCCARTGIL